MDPVSEYNTKRGILITVNGYSGEDDFYLLHQIIQDVVEPDSCGYNVDAMCVGSYYEKGDIRFRASSESPYDYAGFFINNELSKEQLSKVEDWISVIVRILHLKRPKMDNAGKS